MKRHEDNRFDQEVRNKLGHYSTPMAPYILDKILSEVEVVDSTVSHWWKWAAVVLFSVGFGFRLWNPTPEMNLSDKTVEEHQGLLTNEPSIEPEQNRITREIAAIDIVEREIDFKEGTSQAEIEQVFPEELASEELAQNKAIYQESQPRTEDLNSDHQTDHKYSDRFEQAIEEEEKPAGAQLDLVMTDIVKGATDLSEEQVISNETLLDKGLAGTDEEPLYNELSEPMMDSDVNSIEEDSSEASISALQATPSDGFVEQDLEMNAEQLGTENLLQSQTPSWSIEILYGPSLSYRTFDSELNPELVSHKNSNDRSMLSANMSLMIRKNIDEKWSVAAGVQTFNCGEKYSYTVNSATHNFDNAYNYISIPLEADYRIFQKAGISLDVGIGAQYNYLREGTSSWVDLDSSQPVTHNNKGEGSPFSESTIGFNSDVTARYILSPLLDLIVQPRAAVFTKSLYKEETGLDQRPYALSMMVGLSADF